MTDIVPRYEFRAFAQFFDRVGDEIRRLAACQGVDESTELYLLSRQQRDYNVKVRHHQLDIKQLLEETGSLQRWRPFAKQNFPLPGEFISATLLPALGLEGGTLDRDEYTLDEFLSRFVWDDPRLLRVLVDKRRKG